MAIMVQHALNFRHHMKLTRFVLAALAAAGISLSAHAAGNAVLIQMEQDGKFKVWHTEGESHLTEDEIFSLAASALPEGGKRMLTGAGFARAIETKGGTIIVVSGADVEKSMLVDRDACGHVKLWYSTGTTSLTDEQLTELVLSALPDGGKNILVGKRYAKAHSTAIGVMVVLWEPAAVR
mgnify:CR=1 FL=1